MKRYCGLSLISTPAPCFGATDPRVEEIFLRRIEPLRFHSQRAERVAKKAKKSDRPRGRPSEEVVKLEEMHGLR